MLASERKKGWKVLTKAGKYYESSGIYQHDCLILTFETSKYPLNTKEIRRMIIKMKNSLGYDL